MTNTERSTGIKSVQMLLQILDVLKERGSAGVTEIADELGVAKSTVFNHLKTLHEEGYAIKSGQKYHLSLRFLDLGEMARLQITGSKLIEEKVVELAEETKERVQFVVEENGYGKYVYCSIGTKGVETNSRLGKRVPLHNRAAGKAILSQLPDERVSQIFSQNGIYRETENTITDRNELMDELQATRERGYGLNLEESLKGLHAVAVPVMAADNSVIGAIAVSGPSHRLKGERLRSEVPDAILATVNEIELQIEFS